MNKFNLYLLLIASIFIVAASCNVEVVEAPATEIQQAQKAKSACKIEVAGVVEDAYTLKPIAGAEVRLGSILITTNADGKYSLKLSDLLDADSIGVISVRKDNYLLSTTEISVNEVVNQSQCNGEAWVVFQDFLLSPVLPSFKVGAQGGLFEVYPKDWTVKR